MLHRLFLVVSVVVVGSVAGAAPNAARSGTIGCPDPAGRIISIAEVP
jgi:hypothetical protein